MGGGERSAAVALLFRLLERPRFYDRHHDAVFSNEPFVSPNSCVTPSLRIRSPVIPMNHPNENLSGFFLTEEKLMKGGGLMDVDEIPVAQVAKDLGFAFNRRKGRFELDGYKIVIPTDRVWSSALGQNCFKSFSGPDMSGKGAISFVRQYFHMDFRGALDYLNRTYGNLGLTSRPERKKSKPGLHQVQRSIKYLAGTERRKRILVVVDESWLNELAIRVAEFYPWARTEWLRGPRTFQEFSLDDETIVSAIPEGDVSPTFISDVVTRTRHEGGSLHIMGNESPGNGWQELYRVIQEQADRCPIFMYSTPRPRTATPPPNSEAVWDEVRNYLVRERCLDPGVVDDCRARGYLYATTGWDEPERRIWVGAGAVFVTRNENREPTGAFVRATRKETYVAKRSIFGMDRNAGFFWRYVRGEVAQTPPLFVITEAPIEALSIETMALREGRPYSNTLFGAISGAGGEQPFQRRMAQVLSSGGKVIVSFNGDENGAGEVMMQKLAAPFRHEIETGRVKLQKPRSANDWNDLLRNREAG